LQGFLHTERELDDLTKILNLLSAGSVQDLAKSLHIPAKAQSKKSIIEATMREAKTQRSVFFTNGNNIQSTISKRFFLLAVDKSLACYLVQVLLVYKMLRIIFFILEQRACLDYV
jgi:sRNA-binding regulator protein Hfq